VVEWRHNEGSQGMTLKEKIRQKFRQTLSETANPKSTSTKRSDCTAKTMAYQRKKLNNYAPGTSMAFYSPDETDFAEDIWLKEPTQNQRRF
jgi:hypothetical protein